MGCAIVCVVVVVVSSRGGIGQNGVVVGEGKGTGGILFQFSGMIKGWLGVVLIVTTGF